MNGACGFRSRLIGKRGGVSGKPRSGKTFLVDVVRELLARRLGITMEEFEGTLPRAEVSLLVISMLKESEPHLDLDGEGKDVKRARITAYSREEMRKNGDLIWMTRLFALYADGCITPSVRWKVERDWLIRCGAPVGRVQVRPEVSWKRSRELCPALSHAQWEQNFWSEMESDLDDVPEEDFAFVLHNNGSEAQFRAEIAAVAFPAYLRAWGLEDLLSPPRRTFLLSPQLAVRVG